MGIGCKNVHRLLNNLPTLFYAELYMKGHGGGK
jgi:hypothetical protein